MTSANASTQKPGSARGSVLDPQTVIDELRRRGFRTSLQRDGYIALDRDSLRVVLPGPGRALPPKFVRMFEYALERHLGPEWLVRRDPAPAPLGRVIEAGGQSVHVLDAVVGCDGPDEPWCALLADNFAVLGFGASREDALRDLKHAAAAYLDANVADIVLVTPTVL